ncbi:MAG: ferrochelatase [Lentisphaerae bacterium]|nr:ferrochelatase [Lentisphaerota bacterium]
MTHPIGVIVMAYGGPNTLDEIPGFLADIRQGRVTPPDVLDDITDIYRQIGGHSPLLACSTAQSEAIAALLDPQQFTVYLGMRHWAPWIEDTVRTMLDDGIEQAMSLVLAPHFSTLSVVKYQERLHAGLTLQRGEMECAHIDSYHDVPGLITPLANRVLEGIGRWPEAERDKVHVVFSAHSLPVRIIAAGDPYERQLLETAALIARQAGLRDDQWSWSYQSAGRSPEPWLGPQLDAYLPELSERGIRNVVTVPIGFVSDHVEILYDIDIKAQRVAKRYGVRLERPPALNTDPLFMQQLADLVIAKAKERGWS